MLADTTKEHPSALPQQKALQLKGAPTSSCWLLHLSSGYTLGISLYQAVELITSPARLHVPAPKFCNQLVEWRNNLLPVIDFQDSADWESKKSINQIMVVKFSDNKSSVNYLGFTVDSIEKSSISDSDFSILPNWQTLPFSNSVLSTCQKNGTSTYILDLNRLYNQQN